MNKLTKTLSVILFAVLVVPQIALASWWNPFSWFTKPESVVEITTKISTTTVVTSTKVSQTNTTKNVPIVKKETIVKKLTETQKDAIKLPDVNQLPTPQTTVVSTTLCNGVNYSNCPIGANLICPSVGNAYCNTPKTDQQVCEEKFGLNANATGQKNEQGGAVCGCKTGFVWNTTNTECVTIPTPYTEYSNSSVYTGLGRNMGIVAMYPPGCDYFIVETNLGYSLMQWYGGYDPSEGDVFYGDLNSYFFKDITSSNGRETRVWIDDYMLSKSRVLSKYYDKCD